ncbi:MAG TPA: DnaJ domain-containing protein [Solirubrobacteraceae bacterium]
MAAARDPYAVLGISSDASDDELRSSYHHLVQLHHPDHNGGSPESARRFEEVQEAYARIRKQREHAPRTSQGSPARSVDPEVESRLADLERELKDAQAARERARRAAREAAAATHKRPSDEELGYVKTDDTLAKVLADARVEFSDRLAEAREHPAGKRLVELIDELAAKLTASAPKTDPTSGVIVSPLRQGRSEPPQIP